jgi:hypothetical protein
VAAAAAAAAAWGFQKAQCLQSSPTEVVPSSPPLSSSSSSTQQHSTCTTVQSAQSLPQAASATTALQTMLPAKQQDSNISCGTDGTQRINTALDGPGTFSSSWRCAGQVQGGRPFELLRKELHTSSSRQLLSSTSQPVLFPGMNLATCKLVTTGLNNSSSGSTATTTASATTTTTAAAAAPGTSQPQQHHLSVLCSPADHNRFIAADRTKNLPGSYHHLRKPETALLSMTFQDWLHSWLSWKTSRLLLQVEETP